MSSRRQLLVLPFDSSTFPNPSPLLSTVYRTVVSLPSDATHFTLFFASPHSDSPLYATLKGDPVRHWDHFQSFLGKVYACLAAAQWSSGNVLLDVEIAFEGEGGSLPWEGCDVTVAEGLEHLVPSSSTKPPRTIRCPPLGATSGDHDTDRKVGTPAPPVVALGGTFDHLHAAHKLLLHLAFFLASRKIIVGVMADHLLTSKANAALVQPLSERIAAVEDFLARRGGVRRGQGEAGRIEMDVLEITDAFGPTAHDEDIQALVVSHETMAGGEAVNRLRRDVPLPELRVFVIDVIASTLQLADGDQDAAPIGPAEVDKEEDRAALDREGKVRVKVDDEVRTLDLSGMKDEKRLKELKMGSTAIRQWIAERDRRSAG